MAIFTFYSKSGVPASLGCKHCNCSECVREQETPCWRSIPMVIMDLGISFRCHRGDTLFRVILKTTSDRSRVGLVRFSGLPPCYSRGHF